MKTQIAEHQRAVEAAVGQIGLLERIAERLIACFEGGGGDVVAHDAAIDALLTDAAGDQLGVLGPQIDDDHEFMLGRHRRSGEV